jgi:recombinational DNA repair ATPase RecF
MSKSNRQAKQPKHSTARQAEIHRAQESLSALAEYSGRNYDVEQNDVRRLAGLPDQEAERIIGRSQGKRKSLLRLARAEGLAKRPSSRTALRNASRSLAFAYSELFASAHLDRPERLALAEASLRLAENYNASDRVWLLTLRNYYENPGQDEVTPAWETALGADESEAKRLLSIVRKELRFQNFRERTVTNRKSAPNSILRDAELQIPLVDHLSNLRVTSLRVSNYRGISGELYVDFLDQKEKACSCLLLGDNGVGKSSIVSSIEFGCQNRISRQPIAITSASPQAINLAQGAREAEVEVQFNDNTSSSRRVVRSGKDIISQGTTVAKPFGLAPMSLQRADIIRFLNTAPAERGRLFVEYFGQSNSSSIETRTSGLRERLALLKRQRRDLMAELAGVTESGNIPANQENFERLLRLTYFEGLTRRQWEKKYHKSAPREANKFSSQYSELSTAIRRVNLEVKSSTADSNNYQIRVRRLSVLLGDVGTPMTQALHRVTDADWVTYVNVFFGRLSAVSIELLVSLASGQEVTPESIFSEGIQDLVAVLFFLELAQAATLRGQARILILDDIMQSVDSTIRLNLLDYIVDRFKGWQLFITVHDQLWRGQVVQLFRSKGFQFVEREIRTWTPENGPQLRTVQFDDRNPLRSALDDGSISLISAAAGRLLEQISDTLSWTFPISVTRRNGDRYTLADLWPPVSKKLKTTGAASVAEEVDRWLHLRNLMGAHYNDWAESLSQSDADSFAKSIFALYSAVHCDSCGQWVRNNGYSTVFTCRCGKTAVSTV